jgi:hypothetical protein
LIDRHPGRENQAFKPLSNPEKFINIIKNQGILARVMQARICPCVRPNGSANVYCKLCGGDGAVFGFQRRLIAVDEDSLVDWELPIVYPFRVPIIDVLKVQKVREPECGGIVEYNVDSFSHTQINISEKNPIPGQSNLPLHYELMRVTYWFDRFTYLDEVVAVDGVLNILTCSGPVYDDAYKTSNYRGVTGDIAVVDRVHSIANNHDYTHFTFRKNQIYVSIQVGEPPLMPGDIRVSYYYCPATTVLPGDVMTQTMKSLNWSADLVSGTSKVSLEPWYEIAQGDIITFLTPTLYQTEVIVHNTGLDRLREFDISDVSDDIIDEDGVIYHRKSDFVLKNFRDLAWIGTQPAQGKKFSCRYGYHPTFIVYEDNAQSNVLENKLFPSTVSVRAWAKTLNRDLSQMPNMVYS